MLITVFTPTYNRAHLLPRLYESLCRQTYKDFEWVIVDDGSVDDTKDVIDKLKIENGELKINQQFPVRYYYQENGGKHRAINHGEREAKGELFFIADSDDILPPNALEIVKEEYEKIADKNYISGICGLDSYFDGRVIGSGLPKERMLSDNIEVRLRYGITGDMKEVFRTSIIREFPFPEIEEEHFCSEDLVWNRIAAQYKMMYINQVIYCAEYQPEGITSNIIKVRMESPIASTTYYSELENMHIPIEQKIKAAINYWRFWFCLRDKAMSKRIPIIYTPLLPVGLVMHIMDKRKVKK